MHFRNGKALQTRVHQKKIIQFDKKYSTISKLKCLTSYSGKSFLKSDFQKPNEAVVNQNFSIRNCSAVKDCFSNCFDAFFGDNKEMYVYGRLTRRHLPRENNNGDGSVHDDLDPDRRDFFVYFGR